MPPRLADFLTISEAAEVLGVSAETLRNWDRAKKLQAVRHPINGYRLYRKRDLASLLKKLEIKKRRDKKKESARSPE